jgi:hypothetical protein
MDMNKQEHIKALHEAFLCVKPVEFYGQKLHVLGCTTRMPYWGYVEYHFRFEGGNEVKIVVKEDNT